eukprot:CAMPEP_0185042824 /NCGR_PEP_ID=MMETSP1103-20130426/42571_1 /TAXON_ID=36769 /ORGANISM="Paraphysomonas bandaiensis, Strain Caron Lab Isolate" /LENGTH=1240 /DNA_ID=CAMNT_0027582953 /DNA_START=164 /DNA_END=3886 /DNA_ORIENTATION=+
MKLKPPPMAPPPRDLANTAHRPAVENIKAISPSKGLSFAPAASPEDKVQASGPPGRGPPPGRGFTPSYQPAEFEPDTKTGIIEAGRKGAAPPKFTLKPTKKEGAISMFEADPNEKKSAPPPPAEKKDPKAGRPPPPSGPPGGIPEGKPLPPQTLPPSTRVPPRPTRPPPGKGRAPPPLEEEVDPKKPKHTPPTTEPPFKRGYKAPKVEEVVVVKRRDKEFPEFEESSSDEEDAKAAPAVPVDTSVVPSEPMETAKDAAPAVPLTTHDSSPAMPAATTAPTTSTPAVPIEPSVSTSKPMSPQLQKQPTAQPSALAGQPPEGPPSVVPVVQQDVKTPAPSAQDIEPHSAPVDSDPQTQILSQPPAAKPQPIQTQPSADKPQPMQTQPSADKPQPLPSRPTSSSTTSEPSKRPPTVSSAGQRTIPDDMQSDISGSVVSQLITAPPGVEVIKDPNAAVAQAQGVGEFVPPVPLNKEGLESTLAREINGGRLNITCIQGIGLRKRDDKSKNPRVDPYIRFKLGAADKWPWKETQVQRKQDTDASFADELVYFDVVRPSQYIFQEDLQLSIEVWNKGSFKDEVIGTVTMSVVRFFKNPFKAYNEKIPIVAPGDRTSTSKIMLEFLFEEARAGMFVFTLYEAKRLRNVDPMGQQHPYVQMALGSYKKKSKVIEKGGRDPYFAEEDIIMWVDTESWVNDLDILICDHEIGEDNPIAYTDLCLLPYMDILPMAAKRDTFDLFYKPDKLRDDETAQGQLVMKVTHLPAGTLHMNVVRGKGLLPVGKNAPTEGETLRLDPFVNFTLNSQAAKMSKKCPVDKDGGMDPVWSAKLDFDIVDQYLMDVDCYHQNIQGDDELIGSAQVSLLTVFKAGIQNLWVTLKQNKPTGGVRECGDINLQFHFEGPPAIAFPQYRPGMESFDDALRQAPPDEKDDLQVREDDNAMVADILKEGQKSDMMKQEFTDEEIENAFRFIDLDKNNFIGASEIRHILICMGELITDEEIDMMIAMVDIDGDGQVSFDEFRKLVLHPNPAIMDKDGEANEAKLKEIEDEKLVMAGRANEVDSATYQRQKEMQARDMKKKMITNFLHDHEYDFDSLKMGYNSYLDLPREQRANGNVTFNQFCNLLRIDPINENNRLFGLFDPERSGKVDFREFLLGCFNFVELSRDVRLPLTFHMFDEDKTGYISLNEVRQILRGNHMVSLASIERKAQTMMKQAVANDSNAITLKEFLVVTKKFPNIIIPNLSANGKN